MLVTTFGYLWGIFILSTCHSIVNCSSLISLFGTHKFYRLILNPYLSTLVLSFTQNSSYASSVPYTAFKNSAYIILQTFSSMVMYFMYWSRSIRPNNYAIIPSNFKYVLPLVSYVCKKAPRMSDVATYLLSLAPIIMKIPSPVLKRLGMLCLTFSYKVSGRLPSPHPLTFFDTFLFPCETLDRI